MKGIIIFGDSIVSGRGEIPNIGWVGRLKKDFENEFHNCIFNLGIPGDTSTNLLKRFETEVKARVRYKHPGDKFTIIIAIGINDSKAVKSRNKLQTKKISFRKNILKLIQISKEYTKDIILVGLTPVNEKLTNPFEDTYFINSRIKEYNEIIKKATKSKKVKFIELFHKLDNKLLVDGVHPNKKGYELMYNIIKKSI
jgi:lysophospholipase L1-like esterase